jgi:uncharacterized beta-barrel protein YwiB (DUF1934 family)
MSAVKKPVRIRIESSGGGQSSKQQAEGELYETATGSSYVRYVEPGQTNGLTTTTVKWNESEIKIIRHGETKSDLTFIKGARMTGSYWLPKSSDSADSRDPLVLTRRNDPTDSRMLLESVTRAISSKTLKDGYSLKWSYELYSDGQFIGVYRLRLDIHVIS